MRLNPAVIFLAAWMFLFSSFRPYTDPGVKVTITNLRNNNGHVLVSLFKDGAGYPDDASKAVRKAKLTIKDKQAWVLFTGLSGGSYAVAILHDENDDQKMNKTGLGLPKEGYGFSNNAMGAFGPPSYNRASFKFSGSGVTEQTIRTRY